MIEIDVHRKMLCEPIQGFIDQRVVRDRCLTYAKALEPRRALSIVGE
jgi:hypothetical protein